MFAPLVTDQINPTVADLLRGGGRTQPGLLSPNGFGARALRKKTSIASIQSSLLSRFSANLDLRRSMQSLRMQDESF